MSSSSRPYTHSPTSALKLIHLPFSSSTKKERLQGYLSAGDLGELCLSPRPTHLTRYNTIELSDDDIAAIEAAGALGARRNLVRTFLTRAISLALVGSLALGVCSYMGIDVL